MQELTKDTLASFLNRFGSFNDGLIRSFECRFGVGGDKQAIVTISAQDRDAQQGWSNTIVEIQGVCEVTFREGKATCQVLSSGLAVAWFDETVWCDFSPSIEPDWIQEFRQSDFYVVGKRFNWRVEPYSDQ